MYFVYLYIYDLFNILLSSWQTFESVECMCVCVCVCVIIILINNDQLTNNTTL
jgi:hypothetical protein